MSVNDQVPMFGIGTVSRRTGLNAATIRSWEARYGLVLPHRSPSGQRRYTARQIGDLTWIADQIRDGLQSGEAHRLLLDRPEEQKESSAPSIVPAAPESLDLFGEWAEGIHSELKGVMREVARPAGVRTAMVGTNRSHPLFGLSNSVVVGVPAFATRADEDLSRFANLAWSFLPGPAGRLASGETTVFEVTQLDAVGQTLFDSAAFGAAILTPIVVDGVWVGTVTVTVDTPPAPDRNIRAIVEAARDAVAGRYALARAVRAEPRDESM